MSRAPEIHEHDGELSRLIAKVTEYVKRAETIRGDERECVLNLAADACTAARTVVDAAYRELRNVPAPEYAFWRDRIHAQTDSLQAATRALQAVRR
jgi:hypothetical protein